MRQTLFSAAFVAMLVEGIARYPFDAYVPPPPTILGSPGSLTVREAPHEPHGPEGGPPIQFPRGRSMPGISAGPWASEYYIGGY